MLDSNSLIYDIIDGSVGGLQFENKLRSQLELLHIKDKEHTGVGLFVYFSFDQQMDDFRLNASELQALFEQYNHSIDALELHNKDLDIQADVSVHLSEGLIECVEIWNKTGTNYPKAELLTYELRRV